MTKKSTFSIVLLLLFLMLAFTYFLPSNKGIYPRIDIYQSKDFKSDNAKLICSIKDKKTVNTVFTIIDESPKDFGISCSVAPTYIMKIHRSYTNVQTLFLWLGEKGLKGKYAYKSSSETAYIIYESNASKLNEIIKHTLAK